MKITDSVLQRNLVLSYDNVGGLLIKIKTTPIYD